MMKTLLIYSFPFIISLAFSYTGISQIKSEKALQKIPIINKNKSYPKMTFDPEIEITYIPLETKKEILLDFDAHIYYASDKKILIANKRKGDIFIFDMYGKVISHFNQKGGLGYVSISYVVYDKKNREVFIMDKVTRKISVFTEEGTFIRSFRMPKNLIFVKLYNFNENSLLAFHEHQMGPIEPEQRKPYVLISKKDGSILSKLNITLDNANPRYLLSENICYKIGNHYMGINYKYGQEFYLANMSSDTIYQLKQDNTLTPFFVQYPTVFSEPPIITGVVMKTDDYIIFSIYSYDLSGEKKRLEKRNKKPDDNIRFLMYNFKTEKFVECEKWKYPANGGELPQNICIKLIESYDLIERLKLGLLQEELKEVASTLKADSNPVVEIIKFK